MPYYKKKNVSLFFFSSFKKNLSFPKKCLRFLASCLKHKLFCFCSMFQMVTGSVPLAVVEFVAKPTSKKIKSLLWMIVVFSHVVNASINV